MTPQTEFPSPPEGHVGLLGYDSVTKKWYALLVDDDGHLQLDIVALALPSGAATSLKQLPAGHDVTVDNISLAVTGAFFQETQPASVASLPLPSGAAIESKQTTMVTALQKIDDLIAALADVGTDELRVNVIAELPAGTKNIGDVDIVSIPTVTIQAAGGDKLFSFESIVEQALEDEDLATGTNSLEGTEVGSGKVWKITHASIKYVGTTPDYILVRAYRLAGAIALIHKLEPTSDQFYIWEGEIYMQNPDYMYATVGGATATDNFYFAYCGVQMDAPP